MKFFEEVYKHVRNIPEGKVASYGQIAILAGNKRMARQVGWALHSNPDPKTIPCHRVVTKDGNVSKAFAFGGENAQVHLLQSEGVQFNEDRQVEKKFFIET